MLTRRLKLCSEISKFISNFFNIAISDTRVPLGEVIDDVERGEVEGTNAATFSFTDGFAALTEGREKGGQLKVGHVNSHRTNLEVEAIRARSGHSWSAKNEGFWRDS